MSGWGDPGSANGVLVRQVCATGKDRSIPSEEPIANSREGIKLAEDHPSALFAIEVGARSPWISHLLEKNGCQVIVATAHKLRTIVIPTSASAVKKTPGCSPSWPTSIQASTTSILGSFGPDTNLRRQGLKLASRGGKTAKGKALVAVARMLAMPMPVLWCDQDDYRPPKNAAKNGFLIFFRHTFSWKARVRSPVGSVAGGNPNPILRKDF